MFRALQNTVSIDLTLAPEGPLLIRAQSVGIDPGPADMEFQRTYRDGRPTVFLAGSGLKGVLRAHGERLLRSAGRFACDPTKTRDRSSCGKKDVGRPQLPEYPHAGQCGACFTFGSLRLAGRFRVGDAYPTAGFETAANQTEVRNGVGIDRRSQGSASGVLYDAEVVVGGQFTARIQGENFSLWQIGLLLAVLEDLDAGLVRIGGAKARGMGEVRLVNRSVSFGFLDQKTGQLTGTRPTAGDLGQYGLPSNDLLPSPAGAVASRRGLFRTLHFEDDAVVSLSSALIEGPLQRYLAGRT